MNAHFSPPRLQRSLSDVVAEYEAKAAGIPAALAAYTQAGADMMLMASVGGTYGRHQIKMGDADERSLLANLLTSAWLHIYADVKVLMSPNDQRAFDQSMAKPPPFTIENISATFGKFYGNPRGNILRGLAEVFCDLDPAYKSHDKVKIGVAGLPKRIILSNVSGYGSWGRDRLIATINALATYQGKPLFEHGDFAALDALHKWDGHQAGTVEITYKLPGTEGDVRKPRGITVKKFMNGNAHVIFDTTTLRDINKALAEFYGDVLPDTTDEKPTTKQASTAVSKDLQFYPTPPDVVKRVLAEIRFESGQNVLEPSCGDGAFLDALVAKGVNVYGIEVDFARAAAARRKGHAVLNANFLVTVPEPTFDHVVMNPPFYGKHYAKHVEHALKFLKPGGTLTAILPITARHDHGLLDHLIGKLRPYYDGPWSDLPVGAFSASGTNINTTVLTLRKGDDR